jgi:hypothetical protein
MAQKQKIAGVHSRKRKGVDYWYARIDGRMVYFGMFVTGSVTGV